MLGHLTICGPCITIFIHPITKLRWSLYVNKMRIKCEKKTNKLVYKSA